MIHFIIYHECYENHISICHINIFHISLMKFHWIMSFINSYQFNWHDKTSSYWYIFISLMINTHILVIFSSKRRLFNVLEFFKLNDECPEKYFIFNKMVNFLSFMNSHPIINFNQSYTASGSWIFITIIYFNPKQNFHRDKFTPDRWSLITIMNCITMMIFHQYKEHLSKV